MNYNLLAYTNYFLITAFIVVYMGFKFYKNGIHFLLDLFPNDSKTAHFVNKLLLFGYYLLNLGYIAVSLSFWPSLTSLVEVIELTATRSGIIILGLGAMHYFNLFWLKQIPKFISIH